MKISTPVAVTPTEAEAFGFALKKDGQRRTAFDLLSYPDADIDKVARIWPEFSALPPVIAEQLAIDAKYSVYLDRQAADIAAYRRDEAIALPDDLDYAAVAGLSNEVRQKLSTTRPRTLGQAGRIDGITPAALTVLALHLRRPQQADRKSAVGP